jgi:hypothetical protein
MREVYTRLCGEKRKIKMMIQALAVSLFRNVSLALTFLPASWFGPTVGFD